MGQFHPVSLLAEPGGTCRRVDKQHKRPVAGATGLCASFFVSKVTHYPRSALTCLRAELKMASKRLGSLSWLKIPLQLRSSFALKSLKSVLKQTSWRSLSGPALELRMIVGDD